MVYKSAVAWDGIPTLTLTRSWNKLKATESDQQLEDADAHKRSVETLTKELNHNVSDEDTTNWMKEDSSDPRYQPLTDGEIIQQVVNPFRVN